MTTLTPNQAAKKLGISRRTIMRAIESHELAAIRDNRNQWQIVDDDLAHWAPSGQIQSKKTEMPTHTHPVHELQTRIATLEVELAAERRRAEKAEADVLIWQKQTNDWKEQAQMLARPWWKRLVG